MDEGPLAPTEEPVTLSAAMRITGYGKTKLRLAFDAGEIRGFRRPGAGGVDYRFFDRTSVVQWANDHPHVTRSKPPTDFRPPPAPEPAVTNLGISHGEPSNHTDNSHRPDARHPIGDSTGPRQPTRDLPQSDPVAENVALRVIIDALLDSLIEEADSRHRVLAALRTAFRGLDGVRPAIIPTDLLEKLRDLPPHGI